MRESVIHIRVPAETKARWALHAEVMGMGLGNWLADIAEAAIDRHVALCVVHEESGYKEQMRELGGRPGWLAGLGDRAALALMREGYTPESLKAALHDGLRLTKIPNVGKKTASEILNWLAWRDRSV